MDTFFKDLFDYNHYFNQKLIGLLGESEAKTSEKALLLLNHIINSHQIWNSRLLNLPSFGVYDIHPTGELPNLDLENYQSTLLTLQKPDFNQRIEYALTSGKRFSNTVREILFQVINHSTYHRAQIATECRQTGIEPLLTEYIAYKWKEVKGDH